jgi:hypothetical protein
MPVLAIERLAVNGDVTPPAGSTVAARAEGERAGLDRAGKRHLGQASRGGRLVAAEIHAIATVDRSPVAPARPRRIHGAAAPVHDREVQKPGGLP